MKTFLVFCSVSQGVKLIFSALGGQIGKSFYMIDFYSLKDAENDSDCYVPQNFGQFETSAPF